MRSTDAKRQAEEDRHRMSTTLLEEWSEAQDDLMARLVAMDFEREEDRTIPTSAGGRRKR